MKSATWFEVDRRGLGKLMERRGKAFVLHELCANAWDQTVKEVSIKLERMGRYTQLTITDDDPNGFADLADAYTLFAASRKGADASKRGRFNMGDKLAFALCDAIKVQSTTGTIIFDEEGRHNSRSSRETGSEIFASLRSSRDEFEDICLAAERLIPPMGIVTRIKIEDAPERELTRPTFLRAFEVTLPTESTDAEGVLRRSERITTVEVYEPRAGEVASIYELGIPVVDTGDLWHVNVLQRVPLNVERDNVTPAYLRKLRVAVLNAMAAEVPKAEAAKTWVQDATSSPDIEPEAMTTVLTKRFGEKRVAYDPSDPEANKRAVAAGYTVISGGTLNADQWKNAKATNLAPAGKVTPGHKIQIEYGPDGEDWTVPEDKMTLAMREVEEFTKSVALDLIGPVHVEFLNMPISFSNGAHYEKGSRTLTYNVRRLGYDWFERAVNDPREPGGSLLRLIVHELAHHRVGDHLSDEYHDELGRLWFDISKLIAAGTFEWKGKPWRK